MKSITITSTGDCGYVALYPQLQSSSVPLDWLPRTLQRSFYRAGKYKVTRIRSGGVAVRIEPHAFNPAAYADGDASICQRTLRGLGIAIPKQITTVHLKIKRLRQ